MIFGSPGWLKTFLILEYMTMDAPTPTATPTPLHTLESEKLRFKHIKEGDTLRHYSGATYEVVKTYPDGDFTIKKSASSERIKVYIERDLRSPQILIQSSSRSVARGKGLGESKNYMIV